MNLLIEILIGFIAVIHCYILWLEMFAWTTRGVKAFNKPLEEMERTKTLAANQGLYNGFLAAGLIWTFFITDVQWHQNIALFFLSCIAVAGIYGSITASKKILYIQAVPALFTIVFILINNATGK